MPILQNQRHEKFAQELATGKSATEAYCLAGFKPSRQNAARLRTNDDINARVFELQQAAAKSCEISLESVCRELDEAIAVARAKGQAAPLVNAASLRAQLGGLLVEKVELTQSDPFENCESIEAISAKMLAKMSDDPNGEFTDEDRAKAAELFERQLNEFQAFANSCAAKPVNAVDPAQIEHKKLIAERRKLFGGGNGKQRY